MKTTELLNAEPSAISEYLLTPSYQRATDIDAILINLCQRLETQGKIIEELKDLLGRVESLIGGGIR